LKKIVSVGRQFLAMMTESASGKCLNNLMKMAENQMYPDAVLSLLTLTHCTTIFIAIS